MRGFFAAGVFAIDLRSRQSPLRRMAFSKRLWVTDLEVAAFLAP
jgi:hypothetical protein